jgi:outer membrane lipoprotein-sorting protein
MTKARGIAFANGRGLFFAGVFALALVGPHRAAAGPAATTTVPPALIDKLRKIRALTADFREEKRMAILVTPMVRVGKISYEAPDRLAQEVTEPSPSRLVLAANVLTMIDGKERHVLDIDQQPAVGLLVRLFLGVLAGDVAALGQHAKLTFRAPAASGNSAHPKHASHAAAGDAWNLDLDPTDPLLAKLIKSMSVSGHDAIIDVLTLVDGNGDQTVTKFSNVRFPAAFTAQERAARFGVAR